MEPKSEFELERQLRNQHVNELTTFTRTLLTTSSGALALMAGLHSKGPVSTSFSYRFGWLLLCTSMLLGFVVQWKILMAPLHHLVLARRLLAEAQVPTTGAPYPASEPATPIVLHRPPPPGFRQLIAGQIATFAAAFVSLTVAILW